MSDPTSAGTPQDNVRSRYRAPIPPLEGQARAGDSGHARYVRSEPLPRQNGGGFTVGGTSFGLFAGGLPLRLPRKSIGLAAGLALLLGPLGMLYATFLGGFVMVGVVFWAMIFFGVRGLVFAWLLGVAWAAWAAHRRNRLVERLEASASQR